MRTTAALGKHAILALLEALVVAAILAALLLALSPVYKPAKFLADVGGAQAVRLGTISVTFDVSSRAAASTASGTGSHFTAQGCGFRPNSTQYGMVVYGPAPQTSSYGYWVDYFPVGPDGCGSSAVTWTSSGVPGAFQVWVARSPSGNLTTAQPASNVVTIQITDP